MAKVAPFCCPVFDAQLRERASPLEDKDDLGDGVVVDPGRRLELELAAAEEGHVQRLGRRLVGRRLGRVVPKDVRELPQSRGVLGVGLGLRQDLRQELAKGLEVLGLLDLDLLLRRLGAPGQGRG